MAEFITMPSDRGRKWRSVGVTGACESSYEASISDRQPKGSAERSSEKASVTGIFILGLL